MARKKQPQLSATQSWAMMLKSTPLRNERATAQQNESKKTWRIGVPTQRPRYLVPPISWMVRPPAVRYIILDRIGSTVWELCDGHRNVEEIVDVFAAEYDLTFHEARVSVTNYLASLIRRGALAVAVAEE